MFNVCLKKLLCKDVDKLASFQPVTCFVLETHAQDMNQQTGLGNGLGRRHKEMKAIQTKAFTTGKVTPWELIHRTVEMRFGCHVKCLPTLYICRSLMELFRELVDGSNFVRGLVRMAKTLFTYNT